MTSTRNNNNYTNNNNFSTKKNPFLFKCEIKKNIYCHMKIKNVGTNINVIQSFNIIIYIN